MKNSRLVWLSALVVTLAAGILTYRGIPTGRESVAAAAPRAGAPTQSTAAPADEKPVTSALKEGVAALRVRFASKAVPGQQRREPTKWDGQVTASGAKLEQLRLLAG